MATESIRRVAPSSRAEAAEALREAAEARSAVRIRGGGTKLGWGIPPSPEPALEVSTGRLDRIVEHNEGDLTAVLEAGVRLADAQERFAAVGQRLSLDPPLGAGDAATVGGVFSTADAGPLRHRYGAPRDLIVGVTVALSDGTVAKAGGKVIKNVAGYDLSKLFTGAFGTLGMILGVSVRLHPAPERTATAVGVGADCGRIAAAAQELAHSPLEKDCLDVAWAQGRGAVLARFGGAAAHDQAREAVRLLQGQGLDARIEDEDERLWAEQRARQRAGGEGAATVKVSVRQSQLGDALAAAERLGAAVVGRAAMAVLWLRLPHGSPGDLRGAVEELRRELTPSPCVVQDAPAELRAALDPWGEEDERVLALSRRLKERFDPANVCAPGTFVGGI